MKKGLAGRLKTLRQRFREYSPRALISIYGQRAAHTVFPPYLFRFGRSVLVEMTGIYPEKVPALRGFRWRLASPEDIPELCEVSPGKERYRRFFEGGSICVVVENGNGILAMAWAKVGPGEHNDDDHYRHGGYLWSLGPQDAWLHNGGTHPKHRGVGVYLVAFRGLLEELKNRNVNRCFGMVNKLNGYSLQVHRRLLFHPVAHLFYKRILFLGCFKFHIREREKTIWTFKRSVTVSVGDFSTAQMSLHRGRVVQENVCDE